MFSVLSNLTGKIRISNDLLGLHLTPAGTYCARLKAQDNRVSLLAARVLPPFDLTGSDALNLPKALAARQVAICIPSENAQIKLLSFPSIVKSEADEHVRESMGLDDTKYRIGYRFLGSKRQSQTETKILAAAIPEELAQAATNLFRKKLPAPVSLEVDALAVLSNFAAYLSRHDVEEPVACLVSYFKVTFAMFFNKSELLLIRKFNFGLSNVLQAIQKELSVEENTALDILLDGSFDISQTLKTALEPFVKQLVVAKHFIERREDCAVVQVLAPQEKWMTKDWISEISAALGVPLNHWNPLEGLHLQGNALPEQTSLLSAATGTCLGLFSERLGKQK